MLGALRRSAKEASKTLGRASQLQQQRFLNIHEYQVIADRHVAALHLGVDFWLQFRLTAAKKMADSDGEVRGPQTFLS